MTTLQEFSEDYDWQQVLSYAGKDKCWQGEEPGQLAHAPGAVGENPPSTERFGMQDVAEVIASSKGEHDGENWMCALRLHDGRFAYLEAGCDYTGWDCQASGSACVASTLDQLVRFGLTDPARARLIRAQLKDIAP